MADFAGTMKEAAFATSLREFDFSYSTTLEEIFDKLNARRTAFQMPFQIKGGVAGQRIVFENAAHDFPTRISYARDGDVMTARIDGGEGSEQAMEWRFQRADADSRCPA